MKSRLALCAALALAGCDRLPRDPDGTLDRIRSERSFRVGLIATGSTGGVTEAEPLFLGRVAEATGATPIVKQGASEPLLLELEAGKLDLVVGLLSPESPWVDRVTILPPLDEIVAPQHLLLTAAARNGENRWIMLLEREARAVAARTSDER